MLSFTLPRSGRSPHEAPFECGSRCGFLCRVVWHRRDPEHEPGRRRRGLAVFTWALLSGETVPGENILVHDETGGHGAIGTADWLAANGASVEMATPDLHVGRGIGGLNIPVCLRNLYRSGATLTPNHRLKSIRRDGNALLAILWNEFSRGRVERRFDQIVVDTCTLPADGPFHELAAESRNQGEFDVDAFVDLDPQPVDANPHGDTCCSALATPLPSGTFTLPCWTPTGSAGCCDGRDSMPEAGRFQRRFIGSDGNPARSTPDPMPGCEFAARRHEDACASTHSAFWLCCKGH